MPFFSVIIPLYNKELYIKDTLNSVINQTFIDFEVIVINDGSTDNSLNIIKQINDSRIEIINQENKGLSAARNVGIKNAKANYIAFLDADDLWTTDFLQTIFSLIKQYKTEKIFATNCLIWSKKDLPKLQVKSASNNSSLIKNYFSLCKNIFSYSSIVFDITIFKKTGFFNENINYGEEDEFTIKCLLKYNLAYQESYKAYYRVGLENQLTAPKKNSNRIIPDYEVYLKDNSNKDLKKYIDFVHYKLVVLYKMELNYELVNFYKMKIDSSNLSFIKKMKFYLPTILFFYTKTIYIWLKSFSHS